MKQVGVRIVRCPTCRGESIYAASNPYRPFCSERCRNNDLGAWSSEGYRVGTAEADASKSEDTPAVPPRQT
jgi:endogenous inhibitor of DNA gyrase (YacG/DUF329 family)